MNYVYKDDTKRIITSLVMEPETDDCDSKHGEKRFTTAEIESFAHDYLKDYRIIDKNHEYFNTKEKVADVVESWILKEDLSLKGNDETRKYKKGSWFLSLKVYDNETWESIQKGELNGLSVTVLDHESAQKLSTKSRTLIRDIKDPRVVTVSIVDKPCVYNAEICSIKGSDKMEENHEKLDEKILNIVEKFFNKHLSKKEEEKENNDLKENESIIEKINKLEARMEKLEGKIEELDLEKDENEKVKDESIGKNLDTSKSIKNHENKEKTYKNLYNDDERDMYGRKIIRN